MHRIHYLLSTLFVGLILAGAARAEEYLAVKADALKANPQVYWARGIVFTDTLEAPVSEKSIKISGRKYQEFKTRTLGTCYVDAALKSALDNLKLGEDYIFTGTVYQEDKGWFSSRRKFYIAVNRVTVSVSKMEQVDSALREAFTRAELSGPYAEALRVLSSVLSDAQRELAARAAASNLTIQAIFEPGSDHSALVYQATRQALFRQENDSKTPSLEYFISLLASLLAIHNGGLDLTPASAPVAETNAPPAVVAPEPTAAAEPVAPVVERAPEQASVPEAVPMEPAEVIETPAVTPVLEAVAVLEEVVTAIEEPAALPVEPAITNEVPAEEIAPPVEPEPAPAIETPSEPAAETQLEPVLETPAEPELPAETMPEPTLNLAPDLQPEPTEELTPETVEPTTPKKAKRKKPVDPDLAVPMR